MSFEVQSYHKTSQWKLTALPFLKREEAWNNLFWQIIENREKSLKKLWAGNVCSKESIHLSALHTPSNFLLLSQGSKQAVEYLAKYSIDQNWSLEGVSGPEYMVSHFLNETEKLGDGKKISGSRKFKIFQTQTGEELNKDFEEYSLVSATSLDWPKARIWAQQFASEMEPQMDLSATVQMAKKMYSNKTLHLLRDIDNHPCAMAGFGRNTDNYRVINMVFVPKNFRGKGIGGELIKRMTLLSRESGFKNCLLFSEWKEARNLYDLIGCKLLGSFVEYDLS